MIRTFFFIFQFLFFTGIWNTGQAQQSAASSENNYSIQSAISRALQRNNQVLASAFSIKKASWDRKLAWSQLLPEISLNTRYTWIDDSTLALRDFSRYFNDPNSPFQIPRTVFQNAYSTSLDISVPLFDGALFNGLAIAGTNVKMAQQQGKTVKDNVIFQVVSGYLAVLKSRDILDLQKEYLELSRLNSQKAERMFAAGRYSKTESLRWKVEHQQQKSLVVSNETLLRNNVSVLRRVLGLKVTDEIDIDASIPAKIRRESERLEKLPEAELLQMILLSDAKLIAVNAGLSAGKFDAEMSRLLYRNAYASYLPKVSATYSHAWRENNSLALDDYSPKTFMIHVRVPIFSGFKNLSSVKSSYYAHKQKEELFKDQIQQTRHHLTQLVHRLVDLRMRRDLNRAEVEFNAHNYKVVARQKEAGLISNIAFIDAKLSLQNARLAEISTQYDFISNMVELYFLLGKLHLIVD